MLWVVVVSGRLVVVWGGVCLCCGYGEQPDRLYLADRGDADL